MTTKEIKYKRITFHQVKFTGDKDKRGRRLVHYSPSDFELPQNEIWEFLQNNFGDDVDFQTHQGDHLAFDENGSVKDLPWNYWAMQQGLQLKGTVIQIHGKLN